MLPNILPRQLPETSIKKLKKQARSVLRKDFWDYIAGGSGEERASQANKKAFREDLAILNLVLNDVSRINTEITLLGRPIEMPILVGPSAFHRMVTPAGEVATVRAAKEVGTVFISPTMSSTTLEEQAAAVNKGSPLWFQLYPFKDRDLTLSLVKRAETSGYEALVVTVDVPVMGDRLRDKKNKFRLPSSMDAANLRDHHLSYLSDETEGSKIKEYTDKQFDASFSWKDIEWLKWMTHLPIILKGIMNPEDALKAVELNLAGIVVSNHGGRQIDSAEASINALPAIVKVVDKRIPVLMDGGIRSGEDVLKALALGADAVLLGRPVLWALAVGGEKKLVETLNELKQELVTAMRLAGCPDILTIHERGSSLLTGPILREESQSRMLKQILKQQEYLIKELKSLHQQQQDQQ